MRLTQLLRMDERARVAARLVTGREQAWRSGARARAPRLVVDGAGLQVPVVHRERAVGQVLQKPRVHLDLRHGHALAGVGHQQPREQVAARRGHLRAGRARRLRAHRPCSRPQRTGGQRRSRHLSGAAPQGTGAELETEAALERMPVPACTGWRLSGQSKWLAGGAPARRRAASTWR